MSAPFDYDVPKSIQAHIYRGKFRLRKDNASDWSGEMGAGL